MSEEKQIQSTLIRELGLRTELNFIDEATDEYVKNIVRKTKDTSARSALEKSWARSSKETRILFSEILQDHFDSKDYVKNAQEKSIAFLDFTKNEKTGKLSEKMQKQVQALYGNIVPEKERENLLGLTSVLYNAINPQEFDKLLLKKRTKSNLGSKLTVGVTAGLIGTVAGYALREKTEKQGNALNIFSRDPIQFSSNFGGVLTPSYDDFIDFKQGYETIRDSGMMNIVSGDKMTIPVEGLYNDAFTFSDLNSIVENDIEKSTVNRYTSQRDEIFGDELHVLSHRFVESQKLMAELLDIKSLENSELAARIALKIFEAAVPQIKAGLNNFVSAIDVAVNALPPDQQFYANVAVTLVKELGDLVYSKSISQDEMSKLLAEWVNPNISKQQRLVFYQKFLQDKIEQKLQNWYSKSQANYIRMIGFNRKTIPEIYSANVPSQDLKGRRSFLLMMDYFFGSSGVYNVLSLQNYDRNILFSSLFLPGEDRNVILQDLAVPTYFMKPTDRWAIELSKANFFQKASNKPIQKLMDYFASDTLYNDVKKSISYLFENVDSSQFPISSNFPSARTGTLADQYMKWIDNLHVAAVMARTADLPPEKRFYNTYLDVNVLGYQLQYKTGWYQEAENKEKLSSGAELFYTELSRFTEQLFSDVRFAADSTVYNHVISPKSEKEKIPLDTLVYMLGANTNLFQPQKLV